MDDQASAAASESESLYAELESRINAFRRSDTERDKLLHNLVEAYQALELRYNTASKDLANETSSRRHWQEQANIWHDIATRSKEDFEVSLLTSQKEKDASPLVIVLIDGDGAPFLDELYELGEAGGSDAASRLNDELNKIKDRLYPSQSTSHWNVMVTMFINMEGMAKKLRACGIIETSSSLQKFLQAFSRNQPLFQVVDVGAGKELADYKLREWFRVSLGLLQCKHIVLGGICHDTGYLPMLEPYKHDDATCKRVSLLATLPAQAQYKALEKFKPVRVSSVFRSTHLKAKPILYEADTSKMTRAYLLKSPSDILLDGTRTDSPVPVEKSTWAAVSKPEDEHGKSFDVASRKVSKPNYMLLNQQQQRLDIRLPAVDKGTTDRLNRRLKDGGKVCNYYHLTGVCKGGCGFVHGERLPEGEIVALRLKARTRPCTSKGSCRDFDCFFGHVCPFGSNCFGNKCVFSSDAHKMDLVPALKWYDDDRIERLTKGRM